MDTKIYTANGLGDAIAAVLHAVPGSEADREQRPFLAGVHVDAQNHRLWAADGFRIALVQLGDGELPDLFVPFEAAKKMARKGWDVDKIAIGGQDGKQIVECALQRGRRNTEYVTWDYEEHHRPAIDDFIPREYTWHVIIRALDLLAVTVPFREMERRTRDVYPVIVKVAESVGMFTTRGSSLSVICTARAEGALPEQLAYNADFLVDVAEVALGNRFNHAAAKEVWVTVSGNDPHGPARFTSEPRSLEWYDYVMPMNLGR